MKKIVLSKQCKAPLPALESRSFFCALAGQFGPRLFALSVFSITIIINVERAQSERKWHPHGRASA